MQFLVFFKKFLSFVLKLFGGRLPLLSSKPPPSKESLAPANSPGPALNTELKASSPLTPLSVNYHFTRQCNYKCGFCFHTAKSPTHLPLEDAKRGLRLLKEAGTQKVNFSGGEPFLINNGRHLGEMVKYCKEELDFKSVSIVSNGSRIQEKWLDDYGQYVDILAISCDSFDDATNLKIGRSEGKQSHSSKVFKLKAWCEQRQILFKLNTVVNRLNLHEDMVQAVSDLAPFRWKVFQCLLLEGENIGEKALRDASQFTITDQEFQGFLARHQGLSCLVPEDNQNMKDSYLILDEQMRFLDCTQGGKVPSLSILEVGVERALGKSGFDQERFVLRGGIYPWTREKEEVDLSW